MLKNAVYKIDIVQITHNTPKVALYTIDNQPVSLLIENFSIIKRTVDNNKEIDKISNLLFKSFVSIIIDPIVVASNVILKNMVKTSKTIEFETSIFQINKIGNTFTITPRKKKGNELNLS